MSQVVYSNEAEELCLGAAMLSADSADLVARELRSTDFYVPLHRAVFGAVAQVVNEGSVCDPKAVSLALSRSKNLPLPQREIDAKLVTLRAQTGALSNTKIYVEVVAECATRRQLNAVATDIATAANDRTIAVDDIATRAREMVGNISMPLTMADPDPTVSQFLATTDIYDWIIPGLLERGDRLVITGGEGYGKSTMLRQIAVCAAAGLHPFTAERVPAVSVLICDLENGRAQIRRALRSLTLQATLSGCGIAEGMLRICAKPDGLDVLQRSDSRWLQERVQADEPQIMVIGPLYKLFSGSPIDEEPAAAVAKVLDTIRARWDVTLVIEAHSPHAQGDKARTLRPYGASLWRRWPEFGLGLVPERVGEDKKSYAKLKHWRGAREERAWPELLRRGGAWPWTAAA